MVPRSAIPGIRSLLGGVRGKNWACAVAMGAVRMAIETSRRMTSLRAAATEIRRARLNARLIQGQIFAAS
ncbi:MAG: hypothetical protein J0H88_12635, partial [Sphingomonadales bacterium]|nr:hypothetical protein [Sphingomonadales bacterium]